MGYCGSGAGSILMEKAGSTNTKLTQTTTTAAGNFNVRGISGGGRSLAVIDDSHLGIPKGQALQLCFADLFSHEPFTLDAQLDTENTTIFEAIDSTSTTDPVFDNPVMLGIGQETAAEEFLLTLPATTGTTARVLTFSGAIIRDSGYNFTSDDRPRITLTVQPDMKTYQWAAAA